MTGGSVLAKGKMFPAQMACHPFLKSVDPFLSLKPRRDLDDPFFNLDLGSVSSGELELLSADPSSLFDPLPIPPPLDISASFSLV